MSSLNTIAEKTPETLTVGEAKACYDAWLCRNVDAGPSTGSSSGLINKLSTIVAVKIILKELRDAVVRQEKQIC